MTEEVKLTSLITFMYHHYKVYFVFLILHSYSMSLKSSWKYANEKEKLKTITLRYVNNTDNWRPPSLSELTRIIFNMKLTHLVSKTLNSTLKQNFSKDTVKIN